MQRDIPQASRKSPRKRRLTDINRIFIDVLDGSGQAQVISEYSTVESSSERTVIRNFITVPLHPSAYDGSHQSDYESSTDSQSEWSNSVESLISEDSATPDDEMTLEVYDDNPIFSVPVIEVPGEQTTAGLGQQRLVRKDDSSSHQSISVVGKVRGHAVGAVIEPTSTVLMQLSTSSAEIANERVLNCVRDINELLDNEESVVILKCPGVEESQSSRRAFFDHRRATRKMMEMTEDILRRIQGSSRESILVKLQNTLREILNQPEDTIVVHSYSREKLEEEESMGDALVAFFSKDDDTALYVRTMQSKEHQSESFSGSEDEDQMALDRLRNFLQNSMISQEEIIERSLAIEPALTVSQSGNKIVGVLSFPDASSGIVTTTSERFPVDGSHDEKTKSTINLFRKLVQQPSEKLLVQVYSDESRSLQVKQMKQDLDRTVQSDSMEQKLPGISVRESDDKIIGVLSYAGGSIVIQTSSKNWIKHQTNGSPQGLLVAIRLLMEKLIMDDELSETDKKQIASIIAGVFHSETIELSDEFLSKPVLDKIRLIVQQLMKPAEGEDPLVIISEIQDTLQDVARQRSTGNKNFDTGDLLCKYFEELVCNEDSEFQANDILQALRDGLLNILVYYETSISSALDELLELLKTVPVDVGEFNVSRCPGVTLLTDRQQKPPPPSEELNIQSLEVVQQIHDLLSDEEPVEDRAVTYMSMFQTLFLTLVKIFAGWSLKVKAFLNKATEELPRSQPSLGKKPSVSFHLVQESDDETPPDISVQLQQEREHLNETIDELRLYLEQSLGVPDSWQRERRGSLLKSVTDHKEVKDRMLTLFAKLLEESGKLKVTDRSSEMIRLRLESVSGDLLRRESDQFVVLSGSVRDRQHNLGLFFEARLIDLKYSLEMESEMEYVTEVRRLSDEVDDDIEQVVIPTIVESCLAHIGSERDEMEVSVRQESWEVGLRENLSRYFGLMQNFVQESVEPMRDTLEMVLQKMSVLGSERVRELRSSVTQAGSSLMEDYVVELQESGEEVHDQHSGAVEFEDKCIQSNSLEDPESLALHQDDRMVAIEKDLCEIKNKLQLLDHIYEFMADSKASLQSKSKKSTPGLIKSTQNITQFNETDILPSAPPFEELDEYSEDLDVEHIKNLDVVQVVRIYTQPSQVSLPNQDVNDDVQVTQTHSQSFQSSLSSRSEFESAVECSLVDKETIESGSSEQILSVETVIEGKMEAEIEKTPTIGSMDSSPDLIEMPAERADDQQPLERSGKMQDSDIQFISAENCLPEEDNIIRSSTTNLARIRSADESFQTNQEDSLFKVSNSKSVSFEDIFRSHFSSEAMRQSEQFSTPGDSTITEDSTCRQMISSSREELPQDDQLKDGKIQGEVTGNSPLTTKCIPCEDSNDTFFSTQNCTSVAEEIADTSFENNADILTPHESVRVIQQQSLEVLERSAQPEQLFESQSQPISEEIEKTGLTESIPLGSATEMINTNSDDPLALQFNFKLTNEYELSAMEVDVRDSITNITEPTQDSCSEEDLLPPLIESTREADDRLDFQTPTDRGASGSVHETTELVECVLEQENTQLVPADSIQQRITENSLPQTVSTTNESTDHARHSSIVTINDQISTSTQPNDCRNSCPTIREETTNPLGDQRRDSCNLEVCRTVTTPPHLSYSDRQRNSRSNLCSLALSYHCPAEDSHKRYACPAEIYSCHQVGPDQLIIHWDVADQFLDQIVGYKIQLNGELRVVCYSRMRRTALLENVDVNRQHRIAIYPTPKASIGDHVTPWSPGVFFYHR
ncbi:uncharacterized protein LOC129729012 [Wyeomyia smithii]|uniref:uncharacterized protein LOC129729012 n=1 Tax=Wyeomyia smithii TaxID=174621 RepID=UPI0024681966|nr:uncharacterized protein LOC129729012 [Wyeomyia smithii]